MFLCHLLFVAEARMVYSVWWLGCELDDPGFKSQQRQELISSLKHPDQHMRPPSFLNSMHCLHLPRGKAARALGSLLIYG